MGEFSLSGNANIGLSAVEISVNTSKNNSSLLFHTAPSSSSLASVQVSQSQPATLGNGGAGNGNVTIADNIQVVSRPSPAMQDELVDKVVVSGSGSGASVDDAAVSVACGGPGMPGSQPSPGDKVPVSVSVSLSSKDCDSSVGELSVSDKLSEQVVQAGKIGPSLVTPLFHPAEASTPSGALWSTAIEDGYVTNIGNMNGGLGFQNFPSSTQQPQPQPQLFGTGTGTSNTINQNQGRRAITASHNFPHNMGRQQSSHPLYKGYGSWANPAQSWSNNSSVWNRGRSVPNLTPLQQIGVGGRKPSPTFNHQQVMSPVKFRRSTSYPGKGPFPQPPTFEITNMDEARELLPYQDRCGVVSANGSSPLENMRGLEHYLNDMIRQPPDNTDFKGECKKNYRAAALLWTERFPNNPKSHMAFQRLETTSRATGSLKPTLRVRTRTRTDENNAIGVLGAIAVDPHLEEALLEMLE